MSGWKPCMRGPDNKTVLPNVFYRGMSDAEFQAAQKAGKFQSINNREGLYVEKDPTRYTGGGAYGAKRSGVIVQFDTTGLTPKTIRARAAGGFAEDGFDEIPNDKIARVWKWDAAKNDHVLVYEASVDLPPIIGNGFGGGGRGPRKPQSNPAVRIADEADRLLRADQGVRLGRAPGDPSNVQVPATPAAFERVRPTPRSLPAGEAPITSVSDAVTRAAAKAIAAVRSRMASVDDPRQYGPRMASYEPPQSLDAGRPLYDQVGKPERAAIDISGRSPDGAKRGLEYVNQQRIARMEGNEQNAVRIGGITEKQRTAREAREAKERVDAFYGTQAEHLAFKGKAKSAEERARIKRFNDAIAAYRQARAQPLPGKAAIPSDRDQFIYQEAGRLAPPLRLPKRKAEIERKATSMLLDPDMASAGAFAARKAPQGFRPSDKVARGVGYGALVAGGAAAIGVPAAVTASLAAMDKKNREGADRYMADKMRWKEPESQAKSVWTQMPKREREIAQATMNDVVGKDYQITIDGGIADPVYGDERSSQGPKTTRTTAEFQRIVGLPQTGIIDAATRKEINRQTELRMYRYEQEQKSKQGRSGQP